MALVIASLASGLLAQPLQLVAGNDGLIYGARNWGFELAAALSGSSNGQSLETAAMRQKLTGEMVDTFVRQPAQMINFGQVLDGGRCESAYNEVLKGGPHGLEPTIRQAVASCDSALGDYAANPAAGMASGAFLFSPAALVILLLSVVIAGTILLAGVSVLWQALKVIVNLVLGLLPGGTRGSLLLAISEAVMSLILLGVLDDLPRRLHVHRAIPVYRRRRQPGRADLRDHRRRPRHRPADLHQDQEATAGHRSTAGQLHGHAARRRIPHSDP